MKKTVLIIMALVLGLGATFAGPVDVNTAKSVGQTFISTNFEMMRSSELEHVYTFTDNRGDASMYLYNVSDRGFVIVSADDDFRPIVGYSDERSIDVNDMSPEMVFYLNAISNGRSQMKGRAADPQVRAEWQSLEQYGRLLSFNGGKGVPYLVQTKWNQNPAPYNDLCPEDPLGPGGHAYVGCVATAMSQLMKYWNYPAQGQGSNSYVCTPSYGYAGHPEYGTISANFGATTYDWDNMLNSYISNYTPEQGLAVATISFHCGVAVNMQYGNIEDKGSGAHSEDVPGAIYSNFSYTNAANYISYSNIATWKNTLKEQHDKGWPVYYAGVDPDPEDGGGHAFVCDGYDDADLFHFNWGWGGSGDGYFVVTEIDYNTSIRAIINFVPTPVYNSTAKAPTNFTVTKVSDVAQAANISWVNPTQTMNNSSLSSIDYVAIERDGRVIATFENPAPGANMSYVDNEVPCFSTFEYKVYAVKDGAKGTPAKASESFGPTCRWNAIVTTTALQGWKGGYVHVYDGTGREITSFTMTSNNSQNIPLDLTLGRVRFGWIQGSEAVTLSIKLKDANGNVVYEFPSGSSADIPEGYFYVGNNSCTGEQCAIPGELFAEVNDGVVTLNWEGVENSGYGYNIYRDGVLVDLAQNTEYVDEISPVGGHCYQVCVLCDGGESDMSNEVCGTTGEGCDPGSNLWFEIQNSHKPIIYWDAPENEDFQGYTVYRATNDEEYEIIKQLGPDKLQYKETKSLQDGNWYSYRVVAEYSEAGCTSAPFKAKFGNEYCVKILYSTTGVNEFATNVNLYPNPTKDSFTIEGEGLQSVMVYNALGQLVYNEECHGDSVVINLGNVETGIYMVKVVSADGESIQKVSVIK